MRYRIDKAQIKMLLDGKPLRMGNGAKVMVFIIGAALVGFAIGLSV